MPKRDLISIASDFVAKNPRKYFVFMGIFWIVLGIFDFLMDYPRFENVWRMVAAFGYISVGIFSILAGIFKIGLSKKSDQIQTGSLPAFISACTPRQICFS